MGGGERVSAGILLWRRAPDGTPEVLLAHPGGPYFAHRDAGAWGIPKGEPEPGEDLEAVARRELQEETGVVADGPMVPLGDIVQKGGKRVHAWACPGDLDPADHVSITCRIEWPPGSGRRIEIPEVDRVAWFDLEEAKVRIRDRQAPFIDRLAVLLAIGPEEERR